MTSDVTTSLTADIRREHELAQQAFRSTVEHAVRCGELLTQAKAGVAHGKWLPWLDAEFPGSRRTAQGYMRLARHAEDAQGLAHLGIEGALRQLAAPAPSTADLEDLDLEGQVGVLLEAMQTLSERLDAAGDDINEVHAICVDVDAWIPHAMRVSLRAKREYGKVLGELDQQRANQRRNQRPKKPAAAAGDAPAAG